MKDLSNTSDEALKDCHFLDQECLAECLEAIIDEENNTTSKYFVTNLGVIGRFDAEVQLVFLSGILQDRRGCSFIDVDFCEEFEMEDIPSFNPPQLGVSIPPCPVP